MESPPRKPNYELLGTPSSAASTATDQSTRSSPGGEVMQFPPIDQSGGVAGESEVSRIPSAVTSASNILKKRFLRNRGRVQSRVEGVGGNMSQSAKKLFPTSGGLSTPMDFAAVVQKAKGVKNTLHNWVSGALTSPDSDLEISLPTLPDGTPGPPTSPYVEQARFSKTNPELRLNTFVAFIGLLIAVASLLVSATENTETRKIITWISLIPVIIAIVGVWSFFIEAKHYVTVHSSFVMCLVAVLAMYIVWGSAADA
jgi:hypothetical protein